MYAVDMLQELGLPEDLIDSVRSMLEEQARGLKEPADVPPRAFGGSASGELLGHHTSIAHRHVAEAVLQMAEGLRGYGDDLRSFARDLHDRDQQSATELGRRRAALYDAGACIGSPDFRGTTSCSLPTGGADR